MVNRHNASSRHGTCRCELLSWSVHGDGDFGVDPELNLGNDYFVYSKYRTVQYACNDSGGERSANRSKQWVMPGRWTDLHDTRAGANRILGRHTIPPNRRNCAGGGFAGSCLFDPTASSDDGGCVPTLSGGCGNCPGSDHDDDGGEGSGGDHSGTGRPALREGVVWGGRLPAPSHRDAHRGGRPRPRCPHVPAASVAVSVRGISRGSASETLFRWVSAVERHR
mmetsp:Transcript_12820/g.36260  ORF Transcript_12820/g.36260 Transcript_12820/m.36260 type:complete len:223 (+) Transcript_12820:31-699(+)